MCGIKEIIKVVKHRNEINEYLREAERDRMIPLSSKQFCFMSGISIWVGYGLGKNEYRISNKESINGFRRK